MKIQINKNLCNSIGGNERIALPQFEEAPKRNQEVSFNGSN
jgi:hypothetical protein